MPFTIDTSYTLSEVLKSYDPEGRLHHIIDVFSSKRPILEEAYWAQANGDTYHEMLRLASKPSGAFTRINEGYTKEGVATVPVKEQLAMIGSRFELDKRLADKQADPGAWRAQRSKLHIAGMIEAWNEKFWRGSESTDVKEVNGILTRYNSLALDNVHDSSTADVVGTYYPVVIVKWGEDGVNLLYAKGGKKTFWEDDRQIVDLEDDNGNPFPGYRSYFNFQYGIGVGDDRCVQRIANVDPSGIKASSYFEEDLIAAINMLPDQNNAAIYVGRQIMTGIQQRMNAKTNMYFTPDNVWGRTMPTFMGLPVIRDDSLSTAESAVS